MKVFKMRMDVDRYQFFLTDPISDYKRLQMDGSSKQENWSPPKVYVQYPKYLVGNFYNTDTSTLIADGVATKALQQYFRFAGELLPLWYNNQLFTVLNVTQCIDVLDKENTVFVWDESSNYILGVRKYAFIKERFTETALFKIPQFNASEIFVLEGTNDFEIEFREAVAEAGLKGLRFFEIWDSEKGSPGPVFPRIF